MTDPERSNAPPNEFPPEETAPVLDPYFSMDPRPPFHVSELTPDPDATMDLKTWARLYYQMEHLTLWDETPALAATPDVTISVDFPIAGVWVGNEALTWLSLGVAGDMRGEKGNVEGRFGTSVTFDLKKPGLVTAKDVLICLPETVVATTRFTPESKPETAEGLYMANDGSSVAFREITYTVGEVGASEMITLLRQASPSEEEVLESRLKDSMQAMEPSVREACLRYYVDRKPLLIDPEEAFKETTYDWGYLPTQYGNHPAGLMAEHWDRFVAYAPPGITPSDSEVAHTFSASLPKNSNLWVKATWENDKLPGNYEPLFDAPTKLEAVSLADLVKDLPKEAKEHVVKWAQDRLAGYKNWIDINMTDVDSIHSMTESEFNERKRADDDEDEHFYWGLMESWDVCLRQPFRGLTYEENVDRYAELEHAYTSLYAEYVEAFIDIIGDHPVDPTIWPDEAARQDFFRKLKDIETEIQQRQQ